MAAVLVMALQSSWVTGHMVWVYKYILNAFFTNIGDYLNKESITDLSLFLGNQNKSDIFLIISINYLIYQTV